jgi:AbrB family looped-hinge helix DNA binding protein
MAITILSEGRVLLPAEVLEAAHLRDGDQVEIEVTARGILLRPAREHDPDQAWFWTEEWQTREREADADLSARRSMVFESDSAFLEALQAARRTEADV